MCDTWQISAGLLLYNKSGPQRSKTMADPAMAFYLVQGAWDHVDNTHMVFNKAESRLAMPWSRRGAA